MKILVIRFSSIGDIVLTTPVIRCLKQQYPTAQVHYLTKAQFASILEGNPYIDKLHLLGDSLEQCIAKLKTENFTHIIDLHKNLRTASVKKALKVPSGAYPKLNIEKWLLTNFKLDFMPDKSIVDRYFEASGTLKLHNDGQGLDYFVPPNCELHANDLPMSHWSGYVACVIGGSFATKKLPIEKWKLFCEAIPYPVMLLGGKEDAAEGRLIASIDDIKIYNSCGKFSLNESAELIRKAKVVVSNDTGLMHIAAAYKKPIVSVWGNTSPEMGMYPYYGFNNLKTRIAPQSVIIENKTLKCHPCSKLGYNKCPKGHFRCMNDLPVSTIVSETIHLWQQFNPKL